VSGERGPQQTVVTLNRDTQLYKTVRRFGLYFLIAFGLWQARLAITVLAGRTTSVYFQGLLSLVAELHLQILVTVTVGAVAWALIERHLRQRMIARMSERNVKLEAHKDSGRSSSGLTPHGNTHPRDRDA
jgi:flagellar biosynthesis protein FlhB